MQLKYNRGGKREGAGRKPCTDKKQTIIIHLPIMEIYKPIKTKNHGKIRKICKKIS